MPRERTKSIGAGRLAAIVSLFASLPVLTLPAAAQDDRMTAIEKPAEANAIDLNTGPLPDASISESWHKQYGSVFARNVTEATLTPFLPDPGKASGAAVIVAPGGGFRSLSMENEGWDVARRLAERGVAAFVLKYRLNQTPADLQEFARPPQPGGAPAARPARPSPDQAADSLSPQVADARAAFELVRSRAGDWHLDPDRIGMVGFSAGAMLTMTTALIDRQAAPAFVANIYGPLGAVKVPENAPPLFVALAADDPLFPGTDFGLIQSWRAAGRPVEFHYYEKGGHGFGMYPKDTTSTGWFNAFVSWLEMHGMLKPKAVDASASEAASR
ncbi:alpha/beta hydrolase [Croceibacterium sp. LX-88]|uniref:Alpha/beta hydrolase n=1 Tax=Croceibacterium selenioxidans TaxID=2838833 RepID=A0ABS5W800_9SPHN|nr:alpha/beta hydrolase [Croceibacterium selenioxidans]MBT2135779.1 alpha/beta hydrolase [Croceibacterium selenioxidans]